MFSGAGGYGDMERSNSVSGEGQTFLHGYLIIHVNEARYANLKYIFSLISKKNPGIFLTWRIGTAR